MEKIKKNKKSIVVKGIKFTKWDLDNEPNTYNYEELHKLFTKLIENNNYKAIYKGVYLSLGYLYDGTEILNKYLVKTSNCGIRELFAFNKAQIRKIVRPERPRYILQLKGKLKNK